MNDEILIIVPLNKNNELIIEDALNKLNAFSNVLILNYSDNLELIKKLKKDYQILNKENKVRDEYLKEVLKYILDNYQDIKAITIINNLNEIDLEDIINASKSAIENKDSFIMGVKDKTLNNNTNKFMAFLYKCFFNYNVIDAFSTVNAFSLDLAKKLININIVSPNSLITLIENNINIKEINIKTVYHKNDINQFNILNNIKVLYSSFYKYFLKLFIPYVISILIFLTIFYFINYSNDLISLVIINILSGIINIVINIVINYINIYRHNNLGNNFIYVFKKLLKAFIGGFFIYILYNLLDFNLLLSKIIIDIILTIIFYIIFKNVGFKNEKKN